MSIKIPKEVIDALDEKYIERIEHAVTIQEKDPTTFIEGLSNPVKKNKSFSKKKTPQSFFREKTEICTLHRHHNDFFLPFASAIRLGFRDHRPSLPKIKHWPPFNIPLREEQTIILQEAIDHLKKESCVLLAVYPGGGKTITTIRLARVLGLPTLVIVNRLVLMEQWEETIRKCFSNDNLCQRIEGKSIPQPGKLFYVINAINIPKHSVSTWSETLGIGTVIVDECHLILTKVFVQSLGCLAPRFMIGLSATPYRHDGMNELFEVYFNASKTVIYRPLKRYHHVFPLHTPIHYENEYDASGRLIWNRIIDAQSFHEERMDWIVDLCHHFPERRILILGKRVDALTMLFEKLKEKGESAAVFTSNDLAYDTEARILLSTFSKVGTGFSHDCLDSLILANDCEGYFLQYLGRVFRRPDVIPLIFDIVDKHSILQNHFRTRRTLYEQVGGVFQKPPTCWMQNAENMQNIKKKILK